MDVDATAGIIRDDLHSRMAQAIPEMTYEKFNGQSAYSVVYDPRSNQRLLELVVCVHKRCRVMVRCCPCMKNHDDLDEIVDLEDAESFTLLLNNILEKTCMMLREYADVRL